MFYYMQHYLQPCGVCLQRLGLARLSSWHSLAACAAVPAPRHPQCSRQQRPKPLQLGGESPIRCWIVVVLSGLCWKRCCRAVFGPGFRAGRPRQLLRGAQSLAAPSPTWLLLPGPVGFVFGSWRAAEGSSGFGCSAHPLEGSLLILFFLKRINGAAGAAFLGCTAGAAP